MVIKMKLGVCLSGGGIKGVAHIGVLKALEESNIKIDCISGTSSGSIVATLYAAGYSCEEMLEIFNKYSKKIKYIDFSNIFNILKKLIIEHKFIIEGFNSGKIIEDSMNCICADKKIYKIKDIKKDLIIASVSLNSGKVYFFESNKKEYRYSDDLIYIDDINIGKAVRASCSFPGVFCPVHLDNDILIDGGVRENIPWKEIKKRNIDSILCVVFEEKNKVKKNKNIIDSISGSISLLGRELANYELKGADFILKIKTEEISLLDFSKLNYLYKLGYIETKKFLKNIKIK